jgi:endo-1,4-beta-xylanase
MLSQSRRYVGLVVAVVGFWFGCGSESTQPRDAGIAAETASANLDEFDAPAAQAELDAVAGEVVAGGAGPIALPAKFVGNIDTRGSIRSDFANYWNQYTPENAGKWGSVQRSRDAFNWASLDAKYQYCNENGILFKQHTFVWGNQQPTWTADLTGDDGPTVVQAWMKEFCARYPNTKIIDVVNEPPPHTTPAYMNAIGGPGSTGWDWIVNAFTWAHAACPGALLVLNDYSNIELASEAQHTIDIVNVLKKAGAPIDAVGCQAHWTVDVPASTLKANIDKIAAETGLPVYITEYDLDVVDDARQAAVMRDQFTMFWNNDNIKGITLWGYVFGSTWVTNSGLIQSDGTPRPAMTWLMSFLGR